MQTPSSKRGASNKLTTVLLRESVSPSVVRLTLNRPERSNAFSLELLRQFVEELDSFAVPSTVRGVILTAAGKNFCGGLDFHEAIRSDDVRLMSLLVVEILAKLRRLPQIVVAVAHGAARGGGAALLLAADFVVAADDLTIGFPEVRRGLEPLLLFPLLRRRCDGGALREMLIPGLPINAEKAERFGLVHRIVPLDEEKRQTETLVEEILRGETVAVRTAKEAIIAHETELYGPLEEEFALALESHLVSWQSPAAREGVAAFLEKREPAFENRTVFTLK